MNILIRREGGSVFFFFCLSKVLVVVFIFHSGFHNWILGNLLHFLLPVFCFGPALFYWKKMSGIIT